MNAPGAMTDPQRSAVQTTATAAPEITADAQTTTPGTSDITAQGQTTAAPTATVDAITPGADVDVAIDVSLDVTTGLGQALLPPDGLAVLARASWPDGTDAELPAIAGFIASAFSPLAAVLAEQCLSSYFGARPADAERGERTAIVLASSTGDIGTAAAIARAVDQRRRVPPLLFFQSNPGAVVGYISARWGLSGPAACINPTGDPLADAIATAALLIEDGDAAAALIIVAEAGRRDQPYGAALLIGPPAWQPANFAPGGTEAAVSSDVETAVTAGLIR